MRFRPLVPRASLPVLVVLVALPLSGCMAFDTGPDFGYLEQVSFHAVSDYDALTGVARVKVSGTIRAEGAIDVRVEMYVVDRPCAMGPESDPNASIAHETQRVGDVDPGRNETRPYGASFDVRVGAGNEFAAIATAHADNTIGPIFGQCKSLRAV